MNRADMSEYRAWASMKKRCRLVTDKSYDSYGGRGIGFCARWESFANFFEDMGAKPSRLHSLDRIDNDGDYCKENCRWATAEEQSANRRVTFKITAFGRSQSLSAWSREFGVDRQTIRRRVTTLRWSPEEAVSIPVSREHRILHRKGA